VVWIYTHRSHIPSLNKSTNGNTETRIQLSKVQCTLFTSSDINAFSNVKQQIERSQKLKSSHTIFFESNELSRIRLEKKPATLSYQCISMMMKFIPFNKPLKYYFQARMKSAHLTTWLQYFAWFSVSVKGLKKTKSHQSDIYIIELNMYTVNSIVTILFYEKFLLLFLPYYRIITCINIHI
jgi:hypothetical protein